MVTREQFINGVLAYVDNEVINNLPTAGKWGIGAIVVLATSKINSIFEQLVSNPMIKSIGIVTDDGLIDNDSLSNALKFSSNKYGTLEIVVPVLGILSFTSDDVTKLNTYINGGK